MREAPRQQTYDHVDKFSLLPDQLLVPVYEGTKGWSGKVYLLKKKVKAHLILRDPKPLGRFVRFYFDNVSIRQFRAVPQGGIFIASIGATGRDKRVALKTLLNSVQARPLYLRTNNRDTQQVATSLGFRRSADLTEGAYVLMYLA